MSTSATEISDPSVLHTIITDLAVSDIDYDYLETLDSYSEVRAAAAGILDDPRAPKGPMTYGQLVIMDNRMAEKGNGTTPPHLLFLWDRYNTPGKCCICNSNVGDRWPGPLMRGGKTINEGGYCNEDGKHVHRRNLWKTERQRRWKRIMANKENPRSLLISLYWMFFWWSPVLPRHHMDPKTGRDYTVWEKNRPKDRAPLGKKKQAKRLILMLYKLIDEM